VTSLCPIFNGLKKMKVFFRTWLNIVFFGLVFAVFFVSIVDAAEVKNAISRQVGNRMVFSYDLVGKEKEAEVTLTITIKGRKYPSKDLHLEGDYGKVRPGKGKKIYWNVRWDFPRGLHGHFVADLKSGGRPIRGMVYVNGGCFDMGDTFGEGKDEEKPVHGVCVDTFYIGKYEVTQKEWKDVMGRHSSLIYGCDRCPVAYVTWSDVQEYIKKLNRKTGRRYRLPTEAEWEYAARERGKRIRFGTGKDTIGIEEANYWNAKRKNKGSFASVYGGGPMPVGTFAPNALGLYDMSGNVWEWVGDRYGNYRRSPRNNPKGPSYGSSRVFRGGSWRSSLSSLRAAFRNYDPPSYRDHDLGFRLVVGSSLGR